jgi:pyruvate dehydrogenase E1 component alpha subunit
MQQAEVTTCIQSDQLSDEQLVQFYRQMMLIRRFEEKVQDLFLQNLVRGTTHLAIGQEAVAVGACATLRPDDYVLCTYRGHHHVLARGVSVEAAMAEILGRETGLCKGKGGSMHLTSKEHGALGSYPIVGAHIPIATGCAWSAQLRGSGQVTLCFFGDGATNIGAFHEGVNLAAVWQLPIVYICENNLYSEYTPINKTTVVKHPAADRARGNGVPAEVVDGNDLLAVYDAVSEAVARARSGKGPTLIEAKTYRHKGHSRTDPAKYRPPQEVEYWLSRDPIPMLRNRLIEKGAISASELDVLETEVKTEVEYATQAAINAPEPSIDEAYADMFCEEGASWRN